MTHRLCFRANSRISRWRDSGIDAPVGLPGELTISTLVRGVILASMSAIVGTRLFSNLSG
jgi:hypothetical protein